MAVPHLSGPLRGPEAPIPFRAPPFGFLAVQTVELFAFIGKQDLGFIKILFFLSNYSICGV